MPTIAEFDGIKVLMYYQDHDPPHFHVEYGEREALILVADLTVFEGTCRPASCAAFWIGRRTVRRHWR